MVSSLRPRVFLGPSLSHDAARAVLDADYRGPARMNDGHRALRDGVPAIGIIDGVLETAPTLWHKEILWALYNGIPVYGAASLGALRAVECVPWGMIGVGQVYAWFRDGWIAGDDEVAVAHADAAQGYRALSEALVNIRATAMRGVDDGLLTPGEAHALVERERQVYYPERRAPAGLARVDQKGHDARAMLERMAGDQERGWPRPGAFLFEPTIYWEAAWRMSGTADTAGSA
jgi:hypothetical protein